MSYLDKLSLEERILYQNMCNTIEKDILLDPKRRDKYLKEKRDRERREKYVQDRLRKDGVLW